MYTIYCSVHKLCLNTNFIILFCSFLRNSLLYFNGASIASWLPTFSLEVHQPASTNASNSQEFHRGVIKLNKNCINLLSQIFVIEFLFNIYILGVDMTIFFNDYRICLLELEGYIHCYTRGHLCLSLKS